jgi:hypothetical protein
MTVSVHDRRGGEELWSRRWPWHDQHGVLAVVEALTLADTGAGGVVITQEETALTARPLTDPTPLWSIDVTDLFGSLAGRRVDPPYAFAGTGWGRRPAWVWLQRATGSVAEGTRTTHDVFVHARTGTTHALTGVFYLSADGRALSRTGDALTCYALPDPAAEA